MKKAITFTYEEFEKLVSEITYGVMGLHNTLNNGWFWTITMDDNDWNELVDIYGEDAEEEVNRFSLDELEEGAFVYSAISKKFESNVEEIIIDFFNERVAIIFE